MLLQLFTKEAAVSSVIFASRIIASLCVALILLLPFVLVASWVLTPRPPGGLRRLGLLKTSNLVDQYDARHARVEDSPDKGTISVKALYIYPIKSCQPVEVSRAVLTKTGLAYDRCFAFAAEENDDDSKEPPVWRMISQRTKPQMSLINVEIWVPHNRNSDHSNPLTSVGGCLVVTFPDPGGQNFANWMQTFLSTWSWSQQPQVRFTVPLMPTSSQTAQHDIKQKPFNLHSRIAQGLDLGTLPEVAAVLPKLKTFLKISSKQGLTLFRCTSDTLHKTTLNLAPLEYIATRAVHGYTDQQPLHILNLTSVHAVSSLLPPENQPLDALRFRANIYFTGASAYDEEGWKRVQIRTSYDNKTSTRTISPKLSVVCRTSRCTMPNVIPSSGLFEHENPTEGKKRGKPQPSTTLVEHRTVDDENRAALGYLGMHCVPEDSDSDLRQTKLAGDQGVYIEVGDEIVVLERGLHLYGSTGDDY